MTNEQIKQFLEAAGCQIDSVQDYNEIGGHGGVVHICFDGHYHIPVQRCKQPMFNDRLTIAAGRIREFRDSK